MRAVVYDKYGPPDVLRLADVERPVPKDDEVLIRIHAATVNRTDCAIRGGKDFITRFGYSIVTTGSAFKALRRPQQRILGSELAGEVAAVGLNVTQFAVGDRSSASTQANSARMRSSSAWGRIGQWPRCRPACPSKRQRRSATGRFWRWGACERYTSRRGQRILIYGASGSIGTAGVQLAKHSFDAHVTGVCSTKHAETVRSLGPDQVIDYTLEDFTKNAQTYDVIFDAAGKHAFRRCRGSLTPRGIYISTDGWENLFWMPWTARSGGKRVMFDVPPHYRQQDVVFLKGLIEAGKYHAVIDRCYLLKEVVDATKYVETTHKTGNVVLTVNG